MGTTRRPLIWWADRDAGALLDGVDGTVALPQRVAAADPAVPVAARRGGLGLLLEGEAWRAQLDPDRRDPAFAALPWVDPSAAHVPEAWPADFCADFAEAYVDHQDELATLLTTPAHDAPEPVGTLRRRDLELAALCADHVRARALRAPRPGDPHRVARLLAATIRLRPDRLDDAATAWLVDAYAPLDVDAYLVWAAGFGAREAETAALLRLARELRERTGRQVLLGGVGHLWQLACATDAAGALVALPDGMYHGAILGTVDGDVERRRLFMRQPCRCGHHQVGAPPVGAAQIRAHNLWWARREAAQAAVADVGRAELLLAVRAVGAARLRERLGLDPLPAGWRTLVDAGAELAADDAGEH